MGWTPLLPAATTLTAPWSRELSDPCVTFLSGQPAVAPAPGPLVGHGDHLSGIHVRCPRGSWAWPAWLFSKNVCTWGLGRLRGVQASLGTLCRIR